MYEIKVGGQVFCSSKIEETAVLNPILNLEMNKAGTFEFTVPPSHPKYGTIERKTTLIDVYRDDELLFEGICSDIQEDFFKQQKITCEGELTFLNDSKLRPHHYSGVTSRALLEAYIAEHNSLVESMKEFTVGQVTAADSNNSISCYTNYNSTMTKIKEDLIDDIGGFLRVRHEQGVRYLDYLAASPRTSNQVIRLGENLLDLTTNLSAEDIATVIIPLGATLDTQTIPGLDERLTIKTAYPDTMHDQGTDYVYSSQAVLNYGWIEKVVIFEDVTTVAALLAKGEKYLQEVQFENLVIQAKAIDLGLTDDEFNKFRLYDSIRVVSAPHGLDAYFMLTKLQIHLNNPEQDSITLGMSGKHSLTARTAGSNDEIMRIVNELPTSNWVQSAIDNATALITGAEGGYVVFDYDSQGRPKEIRIQDALNNPSKIWRWNQNGFGYSSSSGQTYTTAITMDGAIVADFITSGTMVADRVRGGEFLVGGSGTAAQGAIYVKNSSNQTLITIDKNGISFANGGDSPFTQITRNTVTTAFVNALNVTAKYISTSNLVAAGFSEIGGFNVNNVAIWSKNSATLGAEVQVLANDSATGATWTVDGVTANLAFCVLRNNGSSWDQRFMVSYDGHTGVGRGADLFVEDISTLVSGNGITMNASGPGFTLWGPFNNHSDRRWKKNIEDINENAIDAIYNLRPVSFKYNNIYKDPDGKKHFGFIAQEVKAALEEAGISTDNMALYQEAYVKDRDHQLVDSCLLDYLEFIPLIVQTLQAQKREIEELKEEIHKLKGEE